MYKLLTVVTLTMILICFSAHSSNAGVKKIRPHQLTPRTSSTTWYQNPHWIRSDSTDEAVFYAIVQLPVGKVVKKLTYYHYGQTSPSSTHVVLYRAKPGEFDDLMAYSPENDSSSTIITVVDDTIEFAKVKSGYIYYLEVKSANQNSWISDILITYK